MGLRLSRPECNIPTRFLIGIDNSKNILQNCARHRVAYMIGFLTILTIAILIGYFWTKDDPPERFHVPLWLATVPVLYGIIYYFTTFSSLHLELATEQIEYDLSTMSKKDYLNYKIGDDRTAKSVAASATSAGVLSGSNILGPFLRADR